jgi:urea transport system permease protein
MQSWLTTSYPDLWLLFLGALFMSVVLFIPDGVIGALARVAQWLRGRRSATTRDASPLGQPTLGASRAGGSDTR